MFEDIQKHHLAVQENIKKAFEVGFTGNEDLEKAHQVGDIHPNGKWVWTQLPSGKYDWRVIKKQSQSTVPSQQNVNKQQKTEDGLTKEELEELRALESAARKGYKLLQRDANRLRRLQAKERELKQAKSTDDTQKNSDVDAKVKPSSKKNPSELETISEVEDYAKSISGVTFKSVKSGWDDKGAKAFELTYPHGGKLLIDFLNNEEYVYELTDSNDKTIISTNSTDEISHTDWSIRLNPDKLVSRRVEILKTKLTKLKGEETKARNKMTRNYSSFSDKYAYQKASEAVSDMKTKIQELQSLIGTF